MPPKKKNQAPVEEEYPSSDEVDELMGADDDGSEFQDEVAVDYRPKNKLDEPRNKVLSVELLYGMLDSKDIDLEPEYQRGFVWPTPRQIALIDSLYRNYYIPPVIFHKKKDKLNETDKYICIDGKQRLTSIQRFIEGDFPHVDHVTGNKYWSPKARDKENTSRVKGRKYLSDSVMSDFFKKQVVCIEYSDLTETQERDIFHRVQMGMPLSSAERMAAIASHRASFAHRLEEKMENWPESVKLSGDRKRMFQNIAHVLRGLSTLPKITSPTNYALDKWLREPDVVNDMTSIEEDFDLVIEIAQGHAKVAFPATMSAKLAPVEFIFSVILIHLYKSVLRPDQLASAIQDMRKDVRAQHVDIRTNSKVSLTLEYFITSQMDQKIRLGAYGAVERATPPGQSGMKRKRGATDEDDFKMDTSDDDKPLSPLKRRGPASRTSQMSEEKLFLDSPTSTPTRKKPSNGVTYATPVTTSKLASRATATPASSSSSRAESSPMKARTNLSGAIAPAVIRRGGWGTGLDSLMGSFKDGHQN